MESLEIFDKYGLGGIGLILTLRVITWLGSKGNELLGMHRQYLASTSKQVRRQTLILKTQQTILREHGVMLRQIQERLNAKEEPIPTPSATKAVPLPEAPLRTITGAPALA